MIFFAPFCFLVFISSFWIIPKSTRPSLDIRSTSAVKSINSNIPLAYRWTTTLTTTTSSISTIFSFKCSQTGGFVRLWVDNHILLDGNVSPNTTSTSKYPLPIPFFSKATSSIKIEFIPSTPPVTSSLFVLLANNIPIKSTQLSTRWSEAEATYTTLRNTNEVGWNTWYDFDLLTHAILPQGLALSLQFSSTTSNTSFSNLGTPSCNRTLFPATHGLHDQRGEYTEIETLDFDGNQYRIESATHPNNTFINFILITRLFQPSTNNETITISLNADVPSIWAPRVCDIATIASNDTGSSYLTAHCPGLDAIQVESVTARTATNTTATTTGSTGLDISFASTVSSVAFVARTFATTTNPAKLTPYTLAEIQTIVATRRLSLQQRFKAMIHQVQNNNTISNETAAGLVTSMGWNVIYTVQEGIIAPVFRGSVWGLDQGSGYVLFEWDTFLAGWIATLVDPWLAKNQLIRMSKSMVIDPINGGGVVIGFWNGHCGELDKSKPPIGGMLLNYILNQKGANHNWVGEIVIDQLSAWSKWWIDVRFRQSNAHQNGNNMNMNVSSNALYSPGSTRQLMNNTLMCVYQDPVSASRCETGLDNSPLYDAAVFINATNTIDQIDVGMSALILADALALSDVAETIGRSTLALELKTRANQITEAIQSMAWDDSSDIYMNRNWVTNEFVVPKTAAPTSFYPMVAGISTDDQVQKMMKRWLTNVTEFCVHESCSFGMPSITRSNPAFQDNNYWRGRSWGPMNFLVFLGLKKYDHLKIVKEASLVLVKQSEATFLKEWVKHRRIMENSNSQTGEGCDVENAISFYHWGALNALMSFL